MVARAYPWELEQMAIDDWRDNSHGFQRQRGSHLSCIPRSWIF